MIDISVIIPTYNRSYDLGDALESLEAQEGVEHISWELVVVDNNSNDGTKALVYKFIDRGKLRLTYVFEEQQGLSYACNRGIVEAKGRLLAFTEDDVIVDPHWIRVISETYKQSHFDCMGGKILLLWESPRPPWLSEELCMSLGMIDHGDEVLTLHDSTRQLFTGNLVVHTSVLEKVGKFNVDLGRKGKKLYGGEDTDFFERIIEVSGTTIYQPKAIVHHKVPAKRLRKSYFIKRKYYHGMGYGMAFTYDGRVKVFRVPLQMYFQFVLTACKTIVGLLTFNSQERFSRFLHSCYQLGEIVGLAVSHCKKSR